MKNQITSITQAAKIDAICSGFEERWAASHTGDEFLQKMYNHIDTWQWQES